VLVIFFLNAETPSNAALVYDIQGDLLIEVARIEGKIFKTMKEAEAHGLKLAREWVDRQQKNPAS
jgi:hypothetical protein